MMVIINGMIIAAIWLLLLLLGLVLLLFQPLRPLNTQVTLGQVEPEFLFPVGLFRALDEGPSRLNPVPSGSGASLDFREAFVQCLDGRERER